jgi:hypothetical protein
VLEVLSGVALTSMLGDIRGAMICMIVGRDVFETNLFGKIDGITRCAEMKRRNGER